LSNILITGGSGFIGSHLVDHLAPKNQHQITVYDLYPRVFGSLPKSVQFIQGDLRDRALLRRTLVDHGIDILYHLAWADIHETSIKEPIQDLEVNLISSVAMLEACRETRVSRVVFISSGGAVYGLPRNLPITEDHPTNPISAYGITKLAVEMYLKMYSHLYGLDYVILRPSVPYGPRQNPRRRQGAVTVFIFRTIHKEPITIWGDGEIVRDFFYIEDLIKALVDAAEISSAAKGTFNIGGTRGYSLNEVLQTIIDTLNIQPHVRYESGRKFDAPNIELDTHKAEQILDWHAKVSLPDGILMTAEWLKKWMSS
jgi:UDP-glucose 4-epimerase